MHYYQHHIGDFLKATSRLTDAQSMAYLRLLWMYYDSERPLPDKVDVLAFQVGIDAGTVRLILESYFRLEDGAWKHTRCDKEIAEYKAIVNKRSNAGKASAERKKNTSSTPVQQVLDTGSTDVQLTNNHKPVTNNQEPTTTTKRSSSKGSRLSIDTLPPDWEVFCRSERPDLVPEKVFEVFCDYWIAVPGSKGVKADWFATWKNWVRNQRAVTEKQRKDDSWKARFSSFDTIDMETSNGQVPVLPEDSVPF